MKAKTIHIFLCLVIMVLVCNCGATDTTTFSVKVTHPDPLMQGKRIVLMVKSHDYRKPLTIKEAVIDDNNIQVQLPYSIDESAKEVSITVFLYSELIDGEDVWEESKKIPSAFIKYGSYLPANFTKKYGSPKSVINSIFVLQNDDHDVFSVEIPESLNIRMEPNNFTYDAPYITWDPYPYDMDRYTVAVIVKNKQFHPSNNIDDSGYYITFQESTKDTSVEVYASDVGFTEFVWSDGTVIPPPNMPGDVLRVEVYASGLLYTFLGNSGNFMDSLTIQVK